MKTRLQFKLLTTALLLVFVQGICTAQTYNGSKTLNKNATVPGDVNIKMNNQSSDLKIYTSDEKKITLKTLIEISGKSKEDVDKVIAAIEDSKFKLSGNTMQIDTRFYKSMNTINNSSTITLNSGEKVKIKEFKIRHELNIPKNANINLSNKYSDIEMESMDGKADFELYNCKLYAENFSQGLNIEAKYSKIKLENISQDADFDFYDTDIELQSCGNINISSKYSKYEITKAGKIVVDSYDDKFTIDEMSSLDFTSKYSDVVSQADLNDITLEIYDCNIKVISAVSAFFYGKYSVVVLGNVSNLKIDDSYDNNIYLANTKQIEIGRSKYSLYDFKSITKLKMDDSYNDNIKVGNLNTDFTGLSLKGKYDKLQIEAGTVPFQVQFKIKYPKVDIPESVKIVKHIKENSDLELIGGESGGKISVEGYDMKVVIND